MAGCARCGYVPPSGARFCPACGNALVFTGGDDLAGERKEVTVLFADTVGSTGLVRGMDPEQASALLTPVVDAMMAAVHRFEGTVTHVTGDGIMALFGAPLAVEDHAVRACYAALETPRAVERVADSRIQVRVGLHSGAVLVKAISKDLSIDYTAIGSTVHLAAKLEKAARPGTVLASATTVDLARGFVDTRPAGHVTVAGYTDPVEVHEIHRMRAVRSTWRARSQRTLTPFVARQREMAALLQALDTARTGAGQVVAVVGQAGVGKSRLLHEFVAACHDRAARVLSTGATPYDTMTPYQPLKGVIHDWAGPAVNDDVEAALERAVAGHGEMAPTTVPALTALLDAQPSDPTWALLEPRQRRRAMRDAVRAVLRAEAERAPLTVLIEDLHWIDSETQAVLDDVVASLGASRLLLVVTYRPGYRHAWAATTRFTLLRIDPLRGAGAGDFLGALLGRDPTVTALGSQLLARSEGTPLFLEEWVRALVEEGRLAGAIGTYRLVGDATGLQVPSTVQPILAARVDRLDPASRSVLRVASVVGEQVPLDVLAPLCEVENLETALHRLQAAAFLDVTQVQPQREWTFKHNLTREVVYGSMPLELRRRLHGRVADVLANVRPHQTERLAHHTWNAQRWSAAAHYGRTAGDKAIERSAYPAARRFYEQALQASAQAPQDVEHLELAVDVRLAQRVAVMATGGKLAESLAELSQASAIAQALGDPRRQALAEIHRSYAASTMGDNYVGVQAGEAALAVARAISDVALSSEARIAIAQAHVYAGRWEPVADLLLPDLALLLSDAERLERRGQAATRSLMSLTHLAMARALAGHDAHARRCVAQAEQVAHDTGRPLDRAHLLWTTGTIDRLSGHHDDAVTRFDAGQALALEHELTWWAIQLGPALAAALAAAGRHDDAADAVRRTLPPAMEIGFPMTQTRALVHTAEVEVALGLPEQARVHAQEALRVSQGFDHPLYEAYALRWLAAALVQLDQPEQAGRELARALRLAGALRIEHLAAALREDLDRFVVAGRGGRQPTAG